MEFIECSERPLMRNAYKALNQLRNNNSQTNDNNNSTTSNNNEPTTEEGGALEESPSSSTTTTEFERLKEAIYYPFSETMPLLPNAMSYEKRFQKTIMAVKEVDVLRLAQEIYQTTGKPACILNCANCFNVGGGFERTRGSQEEYLFRNTTLVASLWPHRRPGDLRCPEMNTWFPIPTKEDEIFYPMTDYGGIYSPYVLVTSLDDKPLPNREAYFPCTVLSAAAMDLRPWVCVQRGVLPIFNYDETVKKLRTILHMAAIHKQDHILLTAIGCGAFMNPPKQVASAFHELLTKEFDGVFEYVDFAIIRGTSETLHAFKTTFPGDA